MKIVILITLSLLAVTPRVLGHPPTGIVVDKVGTVYFSDLETVWRLEENGQLSVFRAGVRGRHVHELSIDSDGNIYGADISYEPATEKFVSAVWRMSPTGQFSYLLEPTIAPPPGVNLWLDQHHNMYQVDQNNHLKEQTLVLRRTPEGKVSTLAGGAFGYADGTGTAARFGSIGGMFVTPEGVVYLTDETFVRRISTDGKVTTIARGLDFTTQEDDPRLFGSAGSLAGLAVDTAGNVIVADAGKRRLLKIDEKGHTSVVLRTEPPYFPNGVFALSGDVYVLELGMTLPNAWSGPRIRRITPDGKTKILMTIGEGRKSLGNRVLTATGVNAERILVRFIDGGRLKYTIALIIFALFLTALAWHRRRQRL